MENANSKYDVIVIGSGIGGLTCASILSKLKKNKVLVLERHFKPGGFTHTFRRNTESTYEWDVGLHYVGEMEPGSISRTVFDFITNGELDWQKMPDVYDVFVYPGLTFRVREGRENFLEDLVTLFPAEKKAIYRYFNDLRKCSAWYFRFLIASLMPGVFKPVKHLLKKFGSRIPLTSTREYLESNFEDTRLKALLISQWGTYGLPPENSAFVIQALIANHYLNGGYYPIGGAKTIADRIRQVIENAGGKIAVSHEVTEIILKNNRAVGVKVLEDKKGIKEEHEFYAPVIISAAGAFTTYMRFLKGMFREEINALGSGIAHVSLYAGLKMDPRKLGLHGENYWIYSSFDHEQMYNDRNKLAQGIVTHCYVSFPSLKNPQAKSHTMVIIAFMDGSVFSPWVGMPWKKRGREYDALKQKITSALLQFVEKEIPGLANIIDYTELSTPLSTHFFTGHPGGAIYGIPTTTERYKQDWLKIHTPVQNLFLTGSDIASHGISGAMFGGVLTSAVVMGFPRGLFEIFVALKRCGYSKYKKVAQKEDGLIA